ncbi:uncharacterized protein LOC135211720 isoform X2 [Macrobrachium nipponense]|uniref:uncharacterized protein LOC135211720 isoform X2 n=1 Tax=Macrobrachium nipponense TaxID=159736 RepID=UPI0030C7A45A
MMIKHLLYTGLFCLLMEAKISSSAASTVQRFFARTESLRCLHLDVVLDVTSVSRCAAACSLDVNCLGFNLNGLHADVTRTCEVVKSKDVCEYHGNFSFYEIVDPTPSTTTLTSGTPSTGTSIATTTATTGTSLLSTDASTTAMYSQGKDATATAASPVESTASTSTTLSASSVSSASVGSSITSAPSESATSTTAEISTMSSTTESPSASVVSTTSTTPDISSSPSVTTATTTKETTEEEETEETTTEEETEETTKEETTTEEETEGTTSLSPTTTTSRVTTTLAATSSTTTMKDSAKVRCVETPNNYAIVGIDVSNWLTLYTTPFSLEDGEGETFKTVYKGTECDSGWALTRIGCMDMKCYCKKVGSQADLDHNDCVEVSGKSGDQMCPNQKIAVKYSYSGFMSGVHTLKCCTLIMK